MTDLPITTARMDELLAFLPLFERPGYEPFAGGGGGVEQPDGSTSMPYPIYTDEVARFFRLAGQAWWTDFAYEPRRAGAMLDDPLRLEKAGLDEIRSMLTYCVRGERFADGHWGHLIRTGRLAGLLRRLQAIRDQISG